jgi:hypothetical protein
MPHFRKSLQHNAGDALSNALRLRYKLSANYAITMISLRVWFNGRTKASQALDEGSIPFTRSNLFNRLDFSSPLALKKWRRRISHYSLLFVY